MELWQFLYWNTTSFSISSCLSTTVIAILWTRPPTMGIPVLLMPQSHPTTGPVQFLAPVRFLAHKAEWSAHRNFTPVLFLMVTSGYGPCMAWHTVEHLWFDRIIRRTPDGPRAMHIWVSYGPRTGISNVFHILRDPNRAHAGPVRHRMALL